MYKKMNLIILLKFFLKLILEKRMKQKILRHSLSIKPSTDVFDKSTYTSGRIVTRFKKLFEDFKLFSAVKKIVCELETQSIHQILGI